MCNFGASSEWSNGRRAVISYLDVEISYDQYRMVNPTPLECIAGYIMEDYIGYRALKRLSQKSLPQRSQNIIYGFISSNCSILNSPKRLNIIKQANELTSVLCDIQSGRIGTK